MWESVGNSDSGNVLFSSGLTVQMDLIVYGEIRFSAMRQLYINSSLGSDATMLRLINSTQGVRLSSGAY